MKRALVLGGGGNVGVAWEIGVLAGLLEGGVDARGADIIVGTSAGSVVGANIAHGRDPRELLREQRERPPEPLGGMPAPDMTVVAEIFRLWGSFDQMNDERCAQVGALALKAKTMSEATWREGFARNGWPGWPDKRLLITAVDCESGALRAFERTQNVPIDIAASASCAVPGLFPPVSIEGRKYTDGGVRLGTSADLAAEFSPDVVLIIAPLGSMDRGIHALAKKDIARETAGLEAAGATTRVVHLDEASVAAGGANLMDASLRVPSAAAGEAQGRRLADELRSWWS